MDFLQTCPNSSETSCLMFDMPKTAIIHNGKLYTLRKPLACPDFGNVQICNSEQLDMIPMESCINFERHHDNYTSGSREQLHCKLAPSIGYLLNDDAYLSSPSGLLLRTLSPQIEILYDKPKHQLYLYISAMMKTVDTPESGAIFVPWHKNISAVSFSKSVVYSPVNAMHQVKLTISTDEKWPILTLSPFSLFPLKEPKKLQNF